MFYICKYFIQVTVNFFQLLVLEFVLGYLRNISGT